MFEVTTAGGHAGSQVIDEVCHRIVDVFSWQLFPDQSSWASAVVYGGSTENSRPENGGPNFQDMKMQDRKMRDQFHCIN